MDDPQNRVNPSCGRAGSLPSRALGIYNLEIRVVATTTTPRITFPEVAMNLERPITDRITIADQPAKEDLARFRAEGYVGVVNLRNDGEPEQPMDVAGEGREAEALGLAYHHLGVGGPPLSDPGVAEACDFIDRESAKGKVLVHCRKGGRAAAIVLIQQAKANGWTAAEAIAKGREAGLALDPPLQAKVQAYLDARS